MGHPQSRQTERGGQQKEMTEIKKAVPQSKTITQRNNANSAATVFMAGGMEVKLTPDIVRNYLVAGDPKSVTFQELAMFINLCKFQGLNPWLKEAYLIKYGTTPATLVVGKETFTKRAERHPQYDGFKAGIIVMSGEEIVYREGMFVLPNEEVVGGWADVFRKDRSVPFRSEASIMEYAARKKDGTMNTQWQSKPATMIRKVALVQALREAFPESLGAMYIAEEQGEMPLNLPIENVPEDVVNPNQGEYITDDPTA